MNDKTPRYFYTDALAAAWMAKHFDMKYSNYTEGSLNPQWDNASMFVNRNGNWNNDWFYIHPDSLPILKPQAGDLGQFFSGKHGERICKYDGADWCLMNYLPDTPILTHEFTLAKIIQRNGKAFHSPEVE